jgi:hypothetical protein
VDSEIRPITETHHEAGLSVAIDGYHLRWRLHTLYFPIPSQRIPNANFNTERYQPSFHEEGISQFRRQPQLLEVLSRCQANFHRLVSYHHRTISCNMLMWIHGHCHDQLHYTEQSFRDPPYPHINRFTSFKVAFPPSILRFAIPTFGIRIP